MLKCQDASADVLAMETAQQTQAPEMLKVGLDRVTFSGNQVLIDTAHEMADWKVREYARIPIYFRDQKYFLRQKTAAQRPYAQRYVLEPWPADNQEMARSTLVYDEDTVAQREAEIKGGRIDDLARAALLLVYPLLGMLWSGTKEKLVRFGFVPRSITGVSIFASFALALLQGAFAKLLIMSSLRSGHVVLGGMLRAFWGNDYLGFGAFQVRVLWLDCALFVLFLVDSIIRYSQHLRDVESPWGFAEWLTRLVPGNKTQHPQV